MFARLFGHKVEDESSPGEERGGAATPLEVQNFRGKVNLGCVSSAIVAAVMGVSLTAGVVTALMAPVVYNGYKDWRATPPALADAEDAEDEDAAVPTPDEAIEER